MSRENAAICTAVQKRFGRLKADRTSWQSTWTELKTQLLPAHGRGIGGAGNIGEHNDGARHDLDLYDMQPVRAIGVAGAGMQSGLTSPARPWFSLGVQDPGLADEHHVKLWLADVERRMRSVYSQSNVYRSLHHCYLELLTFGTAAMGIFEVFGSVLRARAYTCGEYWLAQDAQGRVDTMYRQYWMSVGQLRDEFGEDHLSPGVRSCLAGGNVDTVFAVIHAIEPNDDRIEAGVERFAWRSIYMEAGASEEVLKIEGYYEFPVMAPRWHVVAEDTYGHGAGHDVLGDCKMLQKMTEQELVALDKAIEPPMAAPGSMKTVLINTVPGGITYTDDPKDMLRPLYQVTPPIGEIEAKIRDVRLSIRQGLYNDLFLMLIEAEMGKMTATEVAARHEEKLVMLGPVLERLHNELLDPLIDRTFNLMARAGYIPPPPQALQGMPLNVNYISPLALAQKAIALNGVTTLTAFVAQAATIDPAVTDKLDLDEATDAYADALGVPPKLMRDDRAVKTMRANRAKQAQMAAMVQGAQAMAGAAKDAAGADLAGNNALSRIMGTAQQTGRMPGA